MGYGVCTTAQYHRLRQLLPLCVSYMFDSPYVAAAAPLFYLFAKENTVAVIHSFEIRSQNCVCRSLRSRSLRTTGYRRRAHTLSIELQLLNLG